MQQETLIEKIRNLPPGKVAEVEDFVDFLAQRDGEDAAWGEFSLAQAMEGLEDEDAPEYGEADLKERWRQ